MTITTPRGDELRFELHAAAEAADKAHAIMDALAASALVPEKIRSARAAKPFSPEAAARSFTAQRAQFGKMLELLRDAAPAYNGALELNTLGKKPLVTFMLYFQLDGFDAGAAGALVELTRALAGLIGPVYGFGHSRDDHLLASPKPVSSTKPKLDQVFWLNVLGAPLVEALGGPERVRATPAERVEELPGGAFLVLTAPTPAGFADDAARAAQARALAHLTGKKEETIRKALRARSAKLAPVEQVFDPSVAPFLERLVANAGVADRQARARELSAFRPPEPTEWRPLAQALSTDVDDPEETIDEYHGLHSEGLVVMLSDDLPAVEDGDPSVLPDLDHALWQKQYCRTIEPSALEETFIPALGAYLGKMMVQHLGGRWVPRRDRDEAQVIVGDRAWLPFLRARHIMASREDILRHSLTQFHHAAKSGRT